MTITLSGTTGITTVGTVSGSTTMLSPITNSIAADVTLTSKSLFYTGPSVAQGTSGTWLAIGTVTVADNTGAANFEAKLWDGTTVIASASEFSHGAGNQIAISLSGYITSPADNIRISVRDLTNDNAVMYKDLLGLGLNKDSTITAIRIG